MKKALKIILAILLLIVINPFSLFGFISMVPGLLMIVPVFGFLFINYYIVKFIIGLFKS